MPPRPTKRPRIAFLGARGVPARYGGFETFVEEIGARLVDRGVDVTVFCELGRAESKKEQLREHRGMSLQYVRPWAPGPARTIQTDVEGLARCAFGDFDVVVLLGYGAAFAAWLPRLGGARVWINPDGVEWQRSKWGRFASTWLSAMERVACRVASRVVFDNGALRDTIMARNPKMRAPTSVLAYGAHALDDDLPADPLDRFGLSPREYDLLVCRFEPENHVGEILEAHKRAGTGRRLVAVTGIDNPSPYAASVIDGADPDCVQFVGAIYDPEVLEPLRQNAELYLHGHSVGGTNPSLLEAMGASSVVLAHDNPFNREVLGESEVFWKDVTELVERFEAWTAAEPEARDAERRANRERVRQHYCWDRLADDYAALIREDAR